MKKRRVMGIDASTNSIAFSIYDDKQLVKWGIVEFSGPTPEAKLVDARKKLLKLRKEFKADYVVIEKPIYVNNRATVIALAATYGVIVSIVAEGKTFFEITPKAWYKTIKNNGLTGVEKAKFKRDYPGKSESWYKGEFRKARKQITMDWVKREFGVTIVDDNVADAIGVGYYGVVDIVARGR